MSTALSPTPQQTEAIGQWCEDSSELLRVAITHQIITAAGDYGPAALVEVFAVFLANQTHEMGECAEDTTASEFLTQIQNRTRQLLES